VSPTRTTRAATSPARRPARAPYSRPPCPAAAPQAITPSSAILPGLTKAGSTPRRSSRVVASSAPGKDLRVRSAYPPSFSGGTPLVKVHRPARSPPRGLSWARQPGAKLPNRTSQQEAVPSPGAWSSWASPHAASHGSRMVGMTSRTHDPAPSAKAVTAARTGPSPVRTPPEGSAASTRTPLRTSAPAPTAILAKPTSKARRSRWRTRKPKSGPRPEGPPICSPESSRSTAPGGTESPVHRQIGSMRSVAGLGRAPISGAASTRSVVAPTRAAE
jgi:hypothetical protein